MNHIKCKSWWSLSERLSESSDSQSSSQRVSLCKTVDNFPCKGTEASTHRSPNHGGPGQSVLGEQTLGLNWGRETEIPASAEYIALNLDGCFDPFDCDTAAWKNFSNYITALMFLNLFLQSLSRHKNATVRLGYRKNKGD